MKSTFKMVLRLFINMVVINALLIGIYALVCYLFSLEFQWRIAICVLNVTMTIQTFILAKKIREE